MTRRAAPLGILLIFCLFLSACAHISPSMPQPLPGSRQDGLASWYGKAFHGRPTASGEVYNMMAMTAAHRTLPFGTLVRVENRENGHSVDVVINDRGPFVRGRVIDLSYGAARAIGLVGEGVAPVRVVVLGSGDEGRGLDEGLREVDAAAPLTVQIGAFEDPGNAVSIKSRIEEKWGPVSIVPFDAPDGRRFYRVRAGSYTDERKAEAAAGQMEKEGFEETFVTRRDP